jgi:dienelactone hydrolase
MYLHIDKPDRLKTHLDGRRGKASTRAPPGVDRSNQRSLRCVAFALSVYEAISSVINCLLIRRPSLGGNMKYFAVGYCFGAPIVMEVGARGEITAGTFPS